MSYSDQKDTNSNNSDDSKHHAYKGNGTHCGGTRAVSPLVCAAMTGHGVASSGNVHNHSGSIGGNTGCSVIMDGISAAGTHARVTDSPISIASVMAPVAALAVMLGGGASALAGQMSSGSSFSATHHDESIVSTRSFPGLNSARVVAASYSDGVSRSSLRESISTPVDYGEWDLGDNSDLKVPYSRSTDQNNAVDDLKKSADDARTILDDSDGVATELHRSALKSLLDSVSSIVSVDNVSIDDCSKLAGQIDDAASVVEDDVAAVSNAAVTDGSKFSPAPDLGTIKPPDGKTGEDVVKYAMQFVGKVPYVWAGSSPISGWDCSGMVMYVYSQFGIRLSHQSGDQARVGNHVESIADAKPGDIVATDGHAAIYIGNGQVVNALNPGVGTRVTPISWAFPHGYEIRRLIES